MSTGVAFLLFVIAVAIVCGTALWLGEGGKGKPGTSGGSLFSDSMPGHEVGGNVDISSGGGFSD